MSTKLPNHDLYKQAQQQKKKQEKLPFNFILETHKMPLCVPYTVIKTRQLATMTSDEGEEKQGDKKANGYLHGKY